MRPGSEGGMVDIPVTFESWETVLKVIALSERYQARHIAVLGKKLSWKFVVIRSRGFRCGKGAWFHFPDHKYPDGHAFVYVSACFEPA